MWESSQIGNRRLVPVACLASALCAAILGACAPTHGEAPGGQAPAARAADASATRALAAGAAVAGAAPAGATAVPAAAVKFADVSGIRAEMSKSRGRPVVVNFWATWCEPCVKELPDLAAMSREYAGDGPDFLGVSLDSWVIASDGEAEKKVRDALADAGIGYANIIYRGDQDPLVNGFNLPGPIPYSVLYDRQGKQISSWIGGLEKEELTQALAKIR